MKTFRAFKDIVNIIAGVASLILTIGVIFHGGLFLLLPFFYFIILIYFAPLTVLHFLRGFRKLENYKLFIMVICAMLDAPVFVFWLIELLNGDNISEYMIATLFIIVVSISWIIELIYSLISKKGEKEKNSIFNVLIESFGTLAAIVCIVCSIYNAYLKGLCYEFVFFLLIAFAIALNSFTKIKQHRVQYTACLLVIAAVFYFSMYVIYLEYNFTSLIELPDNLYWFASWISIAIILPIVLILNLIYLIKTKEKQDLLTDTNNNQQNLLAK